MLLFLRSGQPTVFINNGCEVGNDEELVGKFGGVMYRGTHSKLWATKTNVVTPGNDPGSSRNKLAEDISPYHALDPGSSAGMTASGVG